MLEKLLIYLSADLEYQSTYRVILSFLIWYFDKLFYFRFDFHWSFFSYSVSNFNPFLFINAFFRNYEKRILIISTKSTHQFECRPRNSITVFKVFLSNLDTLTNFLISAIFSLRIYFHCCSRSMEILRFLPQIRKLSRLFESIDFLRFSGWRFFKQQHKKLFVWNWWA